MGVLKAILGLFTDREIVFADKYRPGGLEKYV